MCVGLGRGVVCVCVGHHRSVGLSLLLSGERDLALGGEERGAVVAVAVVVSVVSVSVSVVAVVVVARRVRIAARVRRSNVLERTNTNAAAGGGSVRPLPRAMRASRTSLSSSPRARRPHTTTQNAAVSEARHARGTDRDRSHAAARP